MLEKLWQRLIGPSRPGPQSLPRPIIEDGEVVGLECLQCGAHMPAWVDRCETCAAGEEARSESVRLAAGVRAVA